ncbi:MAG: hypothetical protein OIF32_04155 [Campylobacterales bacterium]|nr:hypothetical protein [Campylobacterales bacterium]
MKKPFFITFIIFSLNYSLSGQANKYKELENQELESGRKFLKENRLDKAIAAYERVLIYNPDSKEAQRQLKVAYTKEKALKENKSFVTGSGILGIQYNSNIKNSNKDLLADKGYQGVATLRHSYFISRNFYLQTDLMGFYKNYQSLKEEKILFYSFHTGLSYSKNSFVYNLGLYKDSIDYGEDYKVKSFGITPKLFYQYNSDIKLFIKTTLLKREDIQSNGTSKYVEGSIGGNYNFGDVFSYSATYGEESAEKSLEYISKTTLFFSLAYSFLITNAFVSYLKLTSKENNYKNRQDTIHTFDGTLNYSLFNGFITQLLINHSQNNSTLENASYKKTIIGINLIKNF